MGMTHEEKQLGKLICEATKKTNFTCPTKCAGEGRCAYCWAMAESLIANGAIVPPGKTVYRIVDKGTSFAMVMPKSVDELTLFELKDLHKHGYYTSKEEAEKHLK